MDIQFNQVLPTPLSSQNQSENSVWNKDVLLKQGSKIVVEAPSGKGKSTLIHVLYGLRQDYTGDILLGGQALSQFSPARWSKHRTESLAIVFQDLQLFPELTILENLQVKNNLTNRYTLAELEAFIMQVGLSEKLHEKCGQLSMGQQQRVAIIRALCQPFTWLLMDEPFSHLDVENAKICMDIIQQVCQKNGAGWILTALGDHHISTFDQLITI